MTVMESGAWGVIVRMSPASRAPLRVLREQRPNGWDEDGHLASCNLGGGYHMERCIAVLTDAGLLRGADFVVTASSSLVDTPGVQGDLPDWLHVHLQPSGNPPGPEAQMAPEVRETWERARMREYSLYRAK